MKSLFSRLLGTLADLSWWLAIFFCVVTNNQNNAQWFALIAMGVALAGERIAEAIKASKPTINVNLMGDSNE